MRLKERVVTVFCIVILLTAIGLIGILPPLVMMMLPDLLK